MARGQIIVRDLTDGINAPAIAQSNENHTFTADADGSVMSLTGFTSHLTVRIGNTVYEYDGTTTTPSANHFGIGAIISFTGSPDLTLTPTEATVGGVPGATLTLTDSNTSTTGFVDSGGPVETVATLLVYVDGFTMPFTRTVSFSKAIGGNAPVVTVDANTQLIEYAFGSASPRQPTSTFVIDANSENIDTGSFVWSYRIAGTTATPTVLDPENLPTGITITPSDVAMDIDDLLTVTHQAYQNLATTNNGVQFIATREMRRDSHSIYKNRDAAPATGLRVDIFSGPGEYRNNISANDTVLEAILAVGGVDQTGTDWTSGLAGQFQWRRNGVNLTTSDFSVAQQAGEGPTNFRIRINAGDITNGSQDRFDCTVSDSTILTTFSS